MINRFCRSDARDGECQHITHAICETKRTILPLSVTKLRKIMQLVSGGKCFRNLDTESITSFN